MWGFSQLNRHVDHRFNDHLNVTFLVKGITGSGWRLSHLQRNAYHRLWIRWHFSLAAMVITGRGCAVSQAQNHAYHTFCVHDHHTCTVVRIITLPGIKVSQPDPSLSSHVLWGGNHSSAIEIHHSSSITHITHLPLRLITAFPLPSSQLWWSLSSQAPSHRDHKHRNRTGYHTTLLTIVTDLTLFRFTCSALLAVTGFCSLNSQVIMAYRHMLQIHHPITACCH